MNKNIIKICKECLYCEKVYFYNKNTDEYDREFLTCENPYDNCEYKKYTCYAICSNDLLYAAIKFICSNNKSERSTNGCG